MNLFFQKKSVDRKYIENPLKQAPPQVVIRTQQPSVTNTLNEASAKIADNAKGNTTASGKKKYGKSDTTTSPSRSRSATKELVCKSALLFPIKPLN